jgi:hypothetical protein
MIEFIEISDDLIGFLKNTGVTVDQIENGQVASYCHLPFWFKITEDKKVQIYKAWELPKYIDQQSDLIKEFISKKPESAPSEHTL